MKNNPFLFCLILLVYHPATAQSGQVRQPGEKNISTAFIDKTVTDLMSNAEVPGLCLGIINNNKVVFVKAYGYKDAAKTALIDTATCFYAASLAKPLFACIVMQLVAEKKLEPDKPLYTYLPRPLPEYPDYKDLEGDDRWKLITARHCLDHTTGFPNWRWLNPKGNEKLEIFFTPGARYAYSGEGLVLLQMAVEAITGRKLEDIAQEKIFRPLNMTRTSFLWQPSFESNYAIGFNTDGDALPKKKRSTANAAGSMETSVADYTRFVAAFMAGKILSPGSVKEMLSPQIGIYTKHEFPSLNNDTTSANKQIALSYGLGWGLFESSYGKAFFKEGHDDGWEHYVIGFPGKNSAFIIMTNSSNGESIFKELVEKLAGVAIPWEWEGYIPYRPVVNLSMETLQQYTGTYDGGLKIIVTLEKGRLKVSAKEAGLPKTNLYATNDHHFFLKIMDAEIEFVKGPGGKIEKAIVDGDGEHYELKKVE